MYYLYYLTKEMTEKAEKEKKAGRTKNVALGLFGLWLLLTIVWLFNMKK